MRSIKSRPVEIALNGKWDIRSIESRNEIDRVALQMGNETIESRSVEIALGNGKSDREMRRSSRGQWLCIEKSLEFVIRETRECIGQMRIVDFDLAQLQLQIGLGKVSDDALTFLRFTGVVERLNQVLVKATDGARRESAQATREMLAEHLRAIYDAKGTVVPGLGNVRYGRRAVAARVGLEKQSGGARPQKAKAIAQHDLHIDAEGAEKRRFERSQKRFRGVAE